MYLNSINILFSSFIVSCLSASYNVDSQLRDQEFHNLNELNRGIENDKIDFNGLNEKFHFNLRQPQIYEKLNYNIKIPYIKISDDALSQKFGRGWTDSVKNTFGEVIDKTKSVAQSTKDKISSLLGGKNVANDVIVENGILPEQVEKSKFSWGKNLITNLIDKTSNVANSAKEKVSKAVETASNAIGSFTKKSLNFGIDRMLGSFKSIVKILKKDIIVLPNIDAGLGFKTNLEASDGYFRSLSSLSRGGDIDVRRNGNAITLEIPMKIDDMKVGYDHYKVKTLGMGPSGKFWIAIKSNHIKITLTLKVGTTCAVQVNKVEMSEFEDVDIHLEGMCKACGAIASKLTTFLVNFLKSNIKQMIEEKINDTLVETLGDKSTICSQFMM